MRDGLRGAIADTVRTHQLAGPDWTPHMTLAYSNQDAPAAPLVEAMRGAPSPIDVVIRQVSLVSQVRVDRLYRWDRVADIPFRIR